MLLFGAARTKVAATLLGPAGMGLLAQALTMQELLRQSANFGTSRGFLKLVSEYGAHYHVDGAHHLGLVVAAAKGGRVRR